MNLNETAVDSNTEEIANYYDTYGQTQLEVLESEKRSTKNKLLIVAALIFGGDLLALLMGNALNLTTLVYILVVPALFCCVAFLALKEPLLAVIIASIMFLGLIAINIYLVGSASIVSGLLIKAVVVFFILAALGNARDAAAAKRALKAA